MVVRVCHPHFSHMFTIWWCSRRFCPDLDLWPQTSDYNAYLLFFILPVIINSFSPLFLSHHWFRRLLTFVGHNGSKHISLPHTNTSEVTVHLKTKATPSTARPLPSHKGSRKRVDRPGRSSPVKINSDEAESQWLWLICVTCCRINRVSYISGDLQGWSMLTHAKNRAVYMCLTCVISNWMELGLI